MLAEHIRDVFLHVKWSDAKIWTSVLESDRAKSDQELLKIIHHIHETQHAFLSAWLNGTFKRKTFETFDTVSDLMAWGEKFHTSVLPFTEDLTDKDLDKQITLPWAHYFSSALGREPGSTTIRETSSTPITLHASSRTGCPQVKRTGYFSAYYGLHCLGDGRATRYTLASEVKSCYGRNPILKI